MTVVTRFAPSPTGYLHVGGARTALFNWLLARRAGGKFILRIEDTDQTRSSKESVTKIIQDLRWLGLDWEEGPDREGPNGPYFQSQRLEIYRHYVDRLLEMGRAYKCFETPDQLTAARKEASKSGKDYKYNRAGRDLTEQQIKQYEDQGQPCTIRFAMPDRAITVNDMVLGNVTVQPQQLDDFIILKHHAHIARPGTPDQHAQAYRTAGGVGIRSPSLRTYAADIQHGRQQNVQA